MPQGSYCAHWSKENISLKLEFVGGGNPTLNVYELSSNKSEMNVHYGVDTSSLYGDGEKWDFAIELKEPGLVNAIGPGRVGILKALMYTQTFKYGRDYFTHFRVGVYFKPAYCPKIR
ncbi:hypothetical protein FOZ60_015177 [Perkinsus olseni]|uniref:Uncharacterized protein n=1 Tax=Perkinsus olseni TaxID=32597 RepID=A0A7J6P658_PEROL|nr:hypothetical protein FOZ60_015177 [Perkinsus olseni]